MNTVAQYMAKSFQEAAEKASISFHFGETFHYIYIGSIECVTIEEFIPGKFVKYIKNDGSRCVIYSEMNVMTKLMLSFIILMKSRKEIQLYIQRVACSLCDPEVASKENKTDSEEHYFCFGNLSERTILNFTERHVCNRFCRALCLQPPNAEQCLVY